MTAVNHKKFIIFCKTYRNDVLRAKKLLKSIAMFNRDAIPVYFSIPKADVIIFNREISQDYLAGLKIAYFNLITDEDIVLSNAKASLEAYYAMPGQLSQQIIKAEAWRKIGCENYLCIDADSYFTHEFSLKNFIHESGVPYSLMHESEAFIVELIKMDKKKILSDIKKQCTLMKVEFDREGPNYDFGPSPLIWSKWVWESLDEQHFKPRNETIWQAITRLPHEIIWYGEALLKYQAIPIYPKNPLFFCFHYDWQMPSVEELKPYIGIVSQSNWDKTLDSDCCRKSLLSRMVRSFRRTVGRLKNRLKK
ncbi:MAG: DUF6492 family protein [Coxiellaceae bacterium]|nr:DUF6492 family protein [Coxiellaceae bacterium]